MYNVILELLVLHFNIFFHTGPFKIIIFDVKVIANASLAINRDGQLRANEIDADVQLSRMNISFSNLGFFASVFQSFANSAGHTVTLTI